MAPPAPRVSIIMATYNYSQVLPCSIGSVLLQTLPDFELLVVGDGCTDDSAAVVGAIGDERVRWIGLDRNAGHQSAPNNEGLRQARGEIIAYLGHDDLWFPDHLASLVAAIDRGADVAWSATRLVSPDPVDDPIYLLPAYSPGAWIPPSSLAHRRSVTERIGGWSDYRGLAEDPESDLWRRAHTAGFRFASVPWMTLVKFPASRRRNVYRDRPHHEQIAWLNRIAAEPDLGSAELLRVVAAHLPNRMRYRDLLAQLWRATRQRLRRRFNPREPSGMAPSDALEARREFKGLRPQQAPKAEVPGVPSPAVEGDDP
jgi:glycosyltransferase involved in cell wall biosynthesis